MRRGPAVDPAFPVMTDAWSGTEPVTGTFAPDLSAWLAGEFSTAERTARPAPADPWDWRHPDVGWGLVARQPEGAGRDELVAMADLPEDIRRLVTARGGRVFRYQPGRTYSQWTLVDHEGDAQPFLPAVPAGTGAGSLPAFLLVYGNPAQVPWSVQLMLNPVRHVGRLDLEGVALTRYVDALLGEWSESAARWSAPVVWAVDHRAGEITTLMRDVVAAPLHGDMQQDDELRPTFVDGRSTDATVASLTDALATGRPAVVVTSSHGQTGPLDDLAAMRADLGKLVDHDHALLDPQELLRSWQPDGAIWFAQACCSAGADGRSAYEGLFDGDLAATLDGVARLGPVTSPLPRALLGADKPLRAFVGHVEPTFNWTLEFPPNAQELTSQLRTALYERLFLGLPVGYAMEPFYRPVGGLLQGYHAARREYQSTFGAAAAPSLDMMVYSRVTALDRASTVILGDPTVAIPVPPPQRLPSARAGEQR
ncbi:hypothetical protein GCM10009718_23250 [Isoptericola halotolerans]|uniref:CHAT domain-containing protein n=1 Tax=Isoptericola halotolerans TaxID=300560 RepID=A0ABX2A6A0_9MICO|nr:hypothetical protein [Isoptericola halotolerans]NOV98111.1 hypothetical protein [Isoptericola halotolerans]